MTDVINSMPNLISYSIIFGNGMSFLHLRFALTIRITSTGHNPPPSPILFSYQVQGRTRISQRGRQSKRRAPTYYLAKFFRKLHENEENWTEALASKILLCRSANFRASLRAYRGRDPLTSNLPTPQNRRPIPYLTNP